MMVEMFVQCTSSVILPFVTVSLVRASIMHKPEGCFQGSTRLLAKNIGFAYMYLRNVPVLAKHSWSFCLGLPGFSYIGIPKLCLDVVELHLWIIYKIWSKDINHNYVC